MPNTRKSYPPTLKAKVAVDAIRAEKTVTKLAHLHSVYPNLMTKWKRQALDARTEIFRQSQGRNDSVADAEKDELYKQIGQLKVELDFLKKRAGLID